MVKENHTFNTAQKKIFKIFLCNLLNQTKLLKISLNKCATSLLIFIIPVPHGLEGKKEVQARLDTEKIYKSLAWPSPELAEKSKSLDRPRKHEDQARPELNERKLQAGLDPGPCRPLRGTPSIQFTRKLRSYWLNCFATNFLIKTLNNTE